MAISPGCGGGGGGSGSQPDTTPPTVSATIPANGATGVAADATITFTFGESMNASTIIASNLTITPSIAGTLTYDSASNTATFFSSSPMASLTAYTVTVLSECQDAANNRMTADHSWSFTTGQMATTDWVRVGGQIGPNGAEAEDPTVLLVDGIPVVGYRYASFEIALNQWDGFTWGTPVTDPSAGNMSYTSYHAPSFCSAGNVLYMAYSHAGLSGSTTEAFYDRVFAYAWTPGGGWSIMNSGAEISVVTHSPPGANAFEPAIACNTGGDPWVAWLEDDLFDGHATEDVGFVQVTTSATQFRAAPLSRNETSSSYNTTVRSTEVCIDGTDRYVALWEHDAVDQDRTDLYVSLYNGSAFADMGGIIDSDYDANVLSKPSMAVFGGELHIAYTTTPSGGGTRHVHVRKYSGGTWSTVGGGPVTAFGTNHYDSADPNLLVANGRLYVAWDESDVFEGPFIFVAYLNVLGTAWVIDGDMLNVDPSRQALDPCLATSGSHLYVAFEEFTDGHPHIFVKRKQF